MIAELVTIRAVKASLIQSSTVGRPGVGALRCALDSWMFGDRPPDSVLEVRVARHLADYGMTQWEPQLRIGRYRVDFAHRPTQTILEVDGWAFHRQRQAFDADRQRDAALAALGWLVIRITWQQINDDPDATFARVGAVLNARTRRAG